MRATHDNHEKLKSNHCISSFIHVLAELKMKRNDIDMIQENVNGVPLYYGAYVLLLRECIIDKVHV